MTAVPGVALSRAAWIDFIGEFSEPLLPLLPELETQINPLRGNIGERRHMIVPLDFLK